MSNGPDIREEDACAELVSLAAQIRELDNLYYQEDAPGIPDHEYDALRKRFRSLRACWPDLPVPDDPEVRLGTSPQDGFARLAHARPMLSLNNVHDDTELEGFFSSIRRFLLLSDQEPIPCVMEPKIDGLSISLRFVNGKFVSGATRGDGRFGEDVSANLRAARLVPDRLSRSCPEIVELRGEVYMARGDFLALNASLEQEGKPGFANPRNAAAGSLRQLDPSVTEGRKLGLACYGVGEISSFEPLTYWEIREHIRDWGMEPVGEGARVTGMDEAAAWHHRFEARRGELPYDADGTVIKIDRLDWQERLGRSSRAPRWAIAYKFVAEEAQTILHEIQIQVGRTGALTPVAILEPVQVGGALISRATLHNEDEILRKDIRAGDVVALRRAGDVIPQILRSFPDKRPSDLPVFTMPDHCPVCGARAVRTDGLVVRRCLGAMACPAQAVERLRHFVSRRALDVTGLGERHIADFYKEGRLREIGDLFTLEAYDGKDFPKLARLPGWGERSAKKLFETIEARKHISLDRLIYAIGISQIGEATARSLALFYGDFLSWCKAMERLGDPSSPEYEVFLTIDQTGPLLARDIEHFFSDAGNRRSLASLASTLDIQPVAFARDFDKTSSALVGCKIVFTGTLPSMSRREAKSRAESLGARVVGSLSPVTDLLVMGENSGSKARRASEWGVRVIDERQFADLLDGGSLEPLESSPERQSAKKL